jgi:hypothetical protein
MLNATWELEGNRLYTPLNGGTGNSCPVYLSTQGTISYFKAKGNAVFGDDCPQAFYIGGYSGQTATFTNIELDDNHGYNTIGQGIYFNRAAITNLVIRHHNFTNGSTSDHLTWDTVSTCTNIEISDNNFISSITNSHSLSVPYTVGASIIKYNHNNYTDPLNNYYAMVLNATTIIECARNTWNGMNHGAMIATAPTVIADNNNYIAVSGFTGIFGGKSYSVAHPNGMVETAFAANPTSGYWNVGDKWWSSVVTSTTAPGSVCTTAGYGLQGAWTTSTSYTAGQYVTNGGKTYMAYSATWSTTGTATSGATAPTQSSGTQSDGTIVWLWIGNTTTAATWTAMPIL